MIKLEVGSPNIGRKLACFDFDWTLVKPQEGRKFPKDIYDWKYLRESVPIKLHEFVRDGYSIVIFTNQTKKWKPDMIKDVFVELDIPATIFIGMGKKSLFRKPNVDLFTDNIEEWDIINSFFCGDAYDSDKCWSDSDKVFADNIGIKFFKPEELFPFKDFVPNMTDYTRPDQEIIIMVGYPASGKTTVCKNNLQGYEVISGDLHKTLPKMIKCAKPLISAGKSIIFDATHGTIAKRKKIINLAKKYNINVRIFVTQQSMEDAMELNIKRAFFADVKPISKIAYYVYRKKYEEPTLNEAEIFYIPF